MKAEALARAEVARLGDKFKWNAMDTQAASEQSGRERQGSDGGEAVAPSAEAQELEQKLNDARGKLQYLLLARSAADAEKLREYRRARHR